MSDTLLLSLIIFLPALGAIPLVLPNVSNGLAKWWTLVVTIVTCILTFQLFGRFMGMFEAGAPPKTLVARVADDATRLERAKLSEDFFRTKKRTTELPAADPNDLIVRERWIGFDDSLRIDYFLGVDGISLSLVVLTSVLSVLAMLASFTIEKFVRGYCILFLILETGMLGVFLALDFFLFYVFFEVMLLPMYFLIGIWGGTRKEYAAIKFFLYTLLGSVLILIALLAFYFEGKTFDLIKLQQLAAESTRGADGLQPKNFSTWFQSVMFVLLFIGFAIKIPAFPFHTWLPDAHVEAPTPISMILAGVLLKIGGYGLIRIAYPLCPFGAAALAFPVAMIAVVSIVYGAFAAMAQTDFKKLVAYSSVSHMGYVTLGIAVLPVLDPINYAWGLNGAMFQMLAHGVSSAGMFFMVGVIYERAHHRDLNRFGGIMNIMPVYSGLAAVIFFAGMGLPGLCGFIGEFFTVMAGFKYNPTMGICAAFAVVLTAAYILWTLQRVYLGVNPAYEGFPDITAREFIIAAPLVFLAIALGVFPSSVLDWMGPDVEVLANHLTNTLVGPQLADLTK